jgi:hypothetical protein
MVTKALNRLNHRSARLVEKLAYGTATEIKAARELLRQSMVELYELGYWRDYPEKMREYMRVYRASDGTYVSARASMSAPDRTARYSP